MKFGQVYPTLAEQVAIQRIKAEYGDVSAKITLARLLVDSWKLADKSKYCHTNTAEDKKARAFLAEAGAILDVAYAVSPTKCPSGIFLNHKNRL